MSGIYSLAPHVRACSIDGLLIFLDLKRDRYCAIPSSSLQGLDPSGAFGSLPTEGDAPQSLGPLLARGVLVAHGRKLTRNGYPVALFCAFLQASFLLAARRLDRVVQVLGRAKLRAGAREDPAVLLTYYERTRPWWPTNRVCLFDSLSLCLFLASRGVRADLVIGVVGKPFAAHAWAEIDGRVVNDDPTSCGSYREIARA